MIRALLLVVALSLEACGTVIVVERTETVRGQITIPKAPRVPDRDVQSP